MNDNSEPGVILLAEDDADDRMLVTRVLEKELKFNDVRAVGNGEELMDYLERRGKYADVRDSPRPALILLDLNMPRKDGREALHDIKSNPAFRSIPIIVVTTSTSDLDIEQSYDAGVNAFVTKPARFADMVEAFRALHRFWFEVARLPPST